jgi:hypothetical protein
VKRRKKYSILRERELERKIRRKLGLKEGRVKLHLRGKHQKKEKLLLLRRKLK